MDRSGSQEVSLAEPQRKSLCFIGWASTTATGPQLTAVCRAMPDLRRYKLNCFLCELCGSARVNFLTSAQANNSRPGKPPNKKMPDQRPGINGGTGLGMPIPMARKKGESGPTPGYSVFTKNTSGLSHNYFAKTVRCLCNTD